MIAQNLFFSKQKKKFLVSSAINILHNCSKASENRQILCDLRAKERIAPFTKADDLEIVVPALLTLAYITSEEEKKLLEAESRVCILISIPTQDRRGFQQRNIFLRIVFFQNEEVLLGGNHLANIKTSEL